MIIFLWRQIYSYSYQLLGNKFHSLPDNGQVSTRTRKFEEIKTTTPTNRPRTLHTSSTKPECELDRRNL